MPEGLYDADILVWAETQAALLRRLEAGERVNEVIDWVNLIDEVEDVGKSELHSCESLLVQALTHLLKAQAWPNSRAVHHWQAEIVAFLAGARRRFSPSMRRKIDLDDLYRTAMLVARLENDDSGVPRPLPDVNPFTLDRLLADDVTALWASSQD